MWYFLSTNDALEPAIMEVREPAMAYQESTVPRLCVAPSVSQCILALASLQGVYNIYSLDAVELIPADESVVDRHITSEHWVTQDVLDGCGGSIPVSHCGIIDITPDMRLYLKIAIIHKNLPGGWEDKERNLWYIENNEWNPRFHSASDVKNMLL